VRGDPPVHADEHRHGRRRSDQCGQLVASRLGGTAGGAAAQPGDRRPDRHDQPQSEQQPDRGRCFSRYRDHARTTAQVRPTAMLRACFIASF
jgi:hypothetical protein